MISIFKIGNETHDQAGLKLLYNGSNAKVEYGSTLERIDLQPRNYLG